MSLKNIKIDFKFIERQVRKKSFGVLTTLTPSNSAHTTGILYGVSPPHLPFELYFLTLKKYKKIRNIKNNPEASFLIPFPHHLIRFAPSSTITFNGTISLESIENQTILDTFNNKRILRMMLKDMTLEEREEYTFLRLNPLSKVLVYGLGISLLKLRGSHTQGAYSIAMPNDRLTR